MTQKAGTFVVTHVDEASAVLRDVETAQVHTLNESLSASPGTVIEGTIESVPPMDVAWELQEVDEQRTVELVDTNLSPTTQATETAANEDPGTVTRIEREGDGELHVLTVPEGEEAATAEEVLDDEETIARAARLGAVRVEVREGDGLVSVRYLPD